MGSKTDFFEMLHLISNKKYELVNLLTYTRLVIARLLVCDVFLPKKNSQLKSVFSRLLNFSVMLKVSLWLEKEATGSDDKI